MNTIYRQYLLTKNILVAKGDPETLEDRGLLLVRLYNDYGIMITQGEGLVNRDTFSDLLLCIGETVPRPFYVNFPSSVKKLSSEQLLIDQLVHYFVTYGCGNFAEPGHSIFETEEIRPLLQETGEIKKFRIVTELEAYDIVYEAAKDILSTTRPLNPTMWQFILEVYDDINADVSEIFKSIASKNTAMRLLETTRNIRFAKFLALADVPKLVETMISGSEQKINKLNLPNRDRKFIIKVLDSMFNRSNIDNSFTVCYEKKQIWSGLLHHIHYKAKNKSAKIFVDGMHGKKNKSDLSTFEQCMNAGAIKTATQFAVERKGTGFVLRNLNYILSRCKTNLNLIDQVFESFGTDFNPIILIQLRNQYEFYNYSKWPRSFSFTKNDIVKHHRETQSEVEKRKSALNPQICQRAIKAIDKLIEKTFANTINQKVYVGPEMQKMAMPIYESTGNMSIESLTKGSRIPLNGKVVRAFTYWEKVNDIDLSCQLINNDGTLEEFSWRTMSGLQSEAIVFSGDETSGFNGGSEFFDINLDKFKEMYPDARYIVFVDNVFSGITFDKCFCKAGFMLREDVNSGKIYEPKTVKTSYLIDAPTRMPYLFAIDLVTEEMIWLNLDLLSNRAIGAGSDLQIIQKYLTLCDQFNVANFFTMSAAQVVENPEDADLVISNEYEGDNVIHSYDIDKLMSYLTISK